MNSYYLDLDITYCNECKYYTFNTKLDNSELSYLTRISSLANEDQADLYQLAVI